MTIHVSGDSERFIRSLVQGGRFASEQEVVDEAIRQFEQRGPQEELPMTGDEKEQVQIEKPIWEVIQEITAGVSDEAWNALPTALSAQHDHYIYGTPKRPVS